MQEWIGGSLLTTTQPCKGEGVELVDIVYGSLQFILTNLPSSQGALFIYLFLGKC